MPFRQRGLPGTRRPPPLGLIKCADPQVIAAMESWGKGVVSNQHKLTQTVGIRFVDGILALWDGLLRTWYGERCGNVVLGPGARQAAINWHLPINSYGNVVS